MSLLGNDPTTFSHLDLGIFGHSSLWISNSAGLDGECWWAAIFRHVSPEIPNWISVRNLARPFKNNCRVVLKSLLHCFSCVLRIIITIIVLDDHLELGPNSSILVSPDQRIVFLRVCESFRCFFGGQAHCRLSCVAKRRSFQWATVRYRSDRWRATVTVVFLELCPISTLQL